MIVVIDNYDSFVYNLARYFEVLGYPTLVIRNDAVTFKDIEQLNPTHIVISPGPGVPINAGISLSLIKYFYTKVPILGVCLGHQAIGEAFGAQIIPAQHPMHGMASNITYTKSKLFNQLPNPLQVGRYHSLIVSHVPPNAGLKVIAYSQEGEVMALEHIHYPLFGVQFHPEAVLTQCGLQLIENFVNIN